MPEKELRKHLIELLRGGQAHITLKEAVKGFPVEKAGVRPAGSPHSAWELLEHIRIAQEDIALFSGVREEHPLNSSGPPKDYVALKWPDDCWPKSPAPKDASEWKRSVSSIEDDLAGFSRLIEDPKRDLLKPFPWGEGQTLLREALLIADHNAYHVGQLVLLRKMVE